MYKSDISVARAQRRHDLDWLRVIAFGSLIFFHTAIMFEPTALPNMVNDEASPALGMYVAFSHQFRLALLFLVSGMGVRFALRHRDGKTYFAERCRRLLIPLLFGVFVIVPPMVFLEKRFNEQYLGNFVEFYSTLFSGSVYPEGSLSWHHFWFIAYLFLYCMFTWPLFRRWKQVPAKARLDRVGAWIATGVNLYWFIIPLFMIEILLRPLFPGHRDLVSDWASFAHWLVVFMMGYIIAHQPLILKRIEELRYTSLILGTTSSFLLFMLFYEPMSYSFVLNREITIENAIRFSAFSALRLLGVLAWLYTCVGFAARFLNRGSVVLTYLNNAVYPLFCLHHLLIVALGYYILPTDLSIASKFLLIVIGTFLGAFFAYEMMIRRVPGLAVFFGAKNSPSVTQTDQRAFDIWSCRL